MRIRDTSVVFHRDAGKYLKQHQIPGPTRVDVVLTLAPDTSRGPSANPSRQRARVCVPLCPRTSNCTLRCFSEDVPFIILTTTHYACHARERDGKWSPEGLVKKCL